jgi:uncharacterized protein YukE
MHNIIKVDPALLNDKSISVGRLASEYESDYKNIFLKVDSMSIWQGKDNSTYATQILPVGAKLQNLVKILNQYSGLLCDSSNYYQDAQNRIIAQAKRL